MLFHRHDNTASLVGSNASGDWLPLVAAWSIALLDMQVYTDSALPTRPE